MNLVGFLSHQTELESEWGIPLSFMKSMEGVEGRTVGFKEKRRQQDEPMNRPKVQVTHSHKIISPKSIIGNLGCFIKIRRVGPFYSKYVD